MARVYDDLEPTDPDWTRWTGAHVLRRQAAERPDRTLLIAPEEDFELTFAQVLDLSERVAGGLRSAGAASADRVVIMAANSWSFVLSWLRPRSAASSRRRSTPPTRASSSATRCSSSTRSR